MVATLQLDDPEKVRKADVYDGEMPDLLPPTAQGNKVHQRLRKSVQALRTVLAGYENGDMEKEVAEAFKLMYDPRLPLLEFSDCLSQNSARYEML